MKFFRRCIDSSLKNNIDKGGLGRQLRTFIIVNAVFIIICWICAMLWQGAIISDSGKMESLWRVICYFLDPGFVHEDGILTDAKGNETIVWSVRILTPMIAFAGMVLTSGMLVTIFINSVERRVQSAERGEVTYKGVSNHFVIIGYSNITISVIKNLYEPYKNEMKRAPQLVLMTSQKIAKIRADIFAQLPAEYDDKIIIYSGSIESAEQLERLNIDSAGKVYILGEEEMPGRDVKSLECVKVVSNLRGSANGKNLLHVNVQIDRLPSYSMLQQFDMNKGYIRYGNEETPNIYFRPFNFYENWARLLWSYYKDERYSTLDFDTVQGGKYVHLFIVGFNRMGRALLMEALRICHYDNFDESTRANKTKITIIDPKLDEMLPFFETQYPYLDQIEDIEVEFVSKVVEDTTVRNMISEVVTDDMALLTVAVCIKDPDMGLSIGLNLPEAVYYQQDKVKSVKKETVENLMQPKVLIRQETLAGVSNIVSNRDNLAHYKNIRIFGMLNMGVSEELLNDNMAMCVNSIYNQTIMSQIGAKNDTDRDVINELYTKVKSGNKKVVDAVFEQMRSKWVSTAENMRWADRYQIDMYGTYIKYICSFGVTLYSEIGSITEEQLNRIAQIEHRRWIAERTIMGWRQIKSGEQRNNNFFIHNLIVPFSELSEDEIIKDKQVVRRVLQLREVFKKIKMN